METIIIANIFVFSIVSFISIIIGLDLKKWQSWLIGLYGFVSGSLVGYLSKHGSPNWQVGLIFAFGIMSSSVVMQQYRIYYRKVGKEWLSQHGQDQHYSFLTRIIEKYVEK